MKVPQRTEARTNQPGSGAGAMRLVLLLALVARCAHAVTWFDWNDELASAETVVAAGSSLAAPLYQCVSLLLI